MDINKVDINGLMAEIAERLRRITFSEQENLHENFVLMIKLFAKTMSDKLIYAKEIPHAKDFGEYLVGIAEKAYEETELEEAFQYFPLIAEKVLQNYDPFMNQVGIF